jgi:hypothetical protein
MLGYGDANTETRYGNNVLCIERTSAAATIVILSKKLVTGVTPV